ncbi:MAG: DNA-methyltransferase [Candidatus Thorarchaeota archaeon]
MHEMRIDNQMVYFKSSANMEEVDSESITLIVTSPPYWNVKDYGDVNQIGFGQSYSQYIASLNKVWKDCIRTLQPNGKIAINFQPLPISREYSGFNRRIIQNIMFDIEAFMRKNDLYLSGMHYWDKSAYINNVSWGSYPKPTNIASNTSFEQIFVWVKRGKTRAIDKEILEKNLLTKSEWRHWAVRCIWDDISPVIKISSKGENVFGHPAPFPEDIPYRLIRMHTVEGETVLDPFLGSGTTLKVCRLLKRKGIGYEINENYQDLIEKRITEDWNSPKIEADYTTIGTDTTESIIKKIIDLTWKSKTNTEILPDDDIKKNKELIYSKVIESLKKEKIFSTSFLKKIELKKNKPKFKTFDEFSK